MVDHQAWAVILGGPTQVNHCCYCKLGQPGAGAHLQPCELAELGGHGFQVVAAHIQLSQALEAADFRRQAGQGVACQVQGLRGSMGHQAVVLVVALRDCRRGTVCPVEPTCSCVSWHTVCGTDTMAQPARLTLVNRVNWLSRGGQYPILDPWSGTLTSFTTPTSLAASCPSRVACGSAARSMDGPPCVAQHVGPIDDHLLQQLARVDDLVYLQARIVLSPSPEHQITPHSCDCCWDRHYSHRCPSLGSHYTMRCEWLLAEGCAALSRLQTRRPTEQDRSPTAEGPRTAIA